MPQVQWIITAIGVIIAILAFLDNRFGAGRKQENRITKLEEAKEKCDKLEPKVEALIELRVRFDIWWKVFEQKALSGLHHPDRDEMDWYIDHYDELTNDELKEFAENLERLADNPATPPDEKFLALGLFIQVSTKLALQAYAHSHDRPK